jgi:hypothetical protein
LWSQELTKLTRSSVYLKEATWFLESIGLNFGSVHTDSQGPGEPPAQAFWLVHKDGRVLLQIGERIGSWILTKKGKKSIWRRF